MGFKYVETHSHARVKVRQVTLRVPPSPHHRFAYAPRRELTRARRVLLARARISYCPAAPSASSSSRSCTRMHLPDAVSYRDRRRMDTPLSLSLCPITLTIRLHFLIDSINPLLSYSNGVCDRHTVQYFARHWAVFIRSWRLMVCVSLRYCQHVCAQVCVKCDSE
ncbi:hypothetical protein PENSPDRAFT_417303 [Peniophora sp. CONT]|nr:hypothetical protein PENSPDRAFT_417303 [Peniophora sp. CONT]